MGAGALGERWRRFRRVGDWRRSLRRCRWCGVSPAAAAASDVGLNIFVDNVVAAAAATDVKSEAATVAAGVELQTAVAVTM